MTVAVVHKGCPLSYSVRGDGPPVLFIQGVGVHGDGWKPQTDALADRFRCLSFDNRGMGKSQPIGDGPISVEQMADDARVLMDAQGWESAHVVGHSLGGPVALHLALTHRPRVRSLALLCTFGSGRAAAPLTFAMLWFGTRSRLDTRRMRRRAFLRIILPAEVLAKSDPDALAAELAPLFGHDLGDQPPVVGSS
jgi:pimeloyl-ACP methyl ester carboxylesterase